MYFIEDHQEKERSFSSQAAAYIHVLETIGARDAARFGFMTYYNVLPYGGDGQRSISACIHGDHFYSSPLFFSDLATNLAVILILSFLY